MSIEMLRECRERFGSHSNHHNPGGAPYFAQDCPLCNTLKRLDAVIAQAEAPAEKACVAAMEAALWELIKLKDIKEQMESGTASDFLRHHYAEHKDAAWKRAREAAHAYTENAGMASEEQPVIPMGNVSTGILKEYTKGRAQQVVVEATINLVLFCPRCHTQHVDKPNPIMNWTNPPHKSHLCAQCGLIWRPCDFPTNGVKRITTKGKDDTWTP